MRIRVPLDRASGSVPARGSYRSFPAWIAIQILLFASTAFGVNPEIDSVDDAGACWFTSSRGVFQIARRQLDEENLRIAVLATCFTALVPVSPIYSD